MKKLKKTCPSCGGSGQINYFQGASRFLLTTEECPECCGTGYLQEKEAGDPKQQMPDTAAGENKKKSGRSREKPD